MPAKPATGGRHWLIALEECRQFHHLVHWACGGTSDLQNLVLLCHRHHWMVHEGGWQLVKGEDGSLLTLPPPQLIASG